MSANRHPPTHRCEESLSQCASLRHDGIRVSYSDADNTLTEIGKAWVLRLYTFDHDTGGLIVDGGIAEISYCPYCGRKLKASAADESIL